MHRAVSCHSASTTNEGRDCAEPEGLAVDTIDSKNENALDRLRCEVGDLLPLSEAVKVAGKPDRPMSSHDLCRNPNRPGDPRRSPTFSASDLLRAGSERICRPSATHRTTPWACCSCWYARHTFHLVSRRGRWAQSWQRANWARPRSRSSLDGLVIHGSVGGWHAILQCRWSRREPT